MSPVFFMILFSAVVLTINCTTMILTFPGKRSLPFTIGVLALFTAAFYIVLYFTGMIVPDNGGLPGLAYLPVMVVLFKGKLLQKVFAYFLQFLLTSFQVALSQTIGGIFTGYGENVSFAVFLAALLSMLAVYITVVFKYGRRFFEKLYEFGQIREWIFYSLGAIFSFAVLKISQISPGSAGHIFSVLFFILWSFAILCFTIINTNEKSKQRYETEFARDIISSGRDHYQKMSEMLEALRILRHDYKYHLDTISELLNSGNENEAEKYLTDIQNQFSQSELPNYSQNTVINSLLISYSERCTRLNTKYDIEISMPKDIAVPNYEMCIILGNLLENAVEASSRYHGSRRIELLIKTHGTHLAIMVKNNFDGDVAQDDELPVSAKKDGGLGLRSVQAVVTRHGGELMTEWDDTTFSAYVLISI